MTVETGIAEERPRPDKVLVQICPTPSRLAPFLPPAHLAKAVNT
jgi:hypothetical protein